MAPEDDGMLISPPGAPTGALVTNDSDPCKTDCKITIHAEVPSHKTRKSVRLLPHRSLKTVLDKLEQKKIINDALESISCVHVSSNTGQTRQFISEDYDSSIWDLGVRDQDCLRILIETSEKCKKQSKESMLARFRAAATKKLRGSTSNNSLGREKTDHYETQHSPLGLLFGVPLEIVGDLGPPLMSADHLGVPAFFESAFAYLAEYECKTEGLFRLSGSASTIKAYKKTLDLGEQLMWVPDMDAHNATGLIKMYLRELPEPLLTFNLFEPFYVAVKCTQEEMQLKCVLSLLSGLPHLHYNLFKFLICTLQRFLDFEVDTKMGISNLATLFGPNIARPEHEINEQHEMLLATSKATAITSFFLANVEKVFQDNSVALYPAVCRVIYEYEAGEDDELSLVIGDIIFVDEVVEDSWWSGVTIDKATQVPRKGRFPSNYTDILFNHKAVLPLSTLIPVKVSPASGPCDALQDADMPVAGSLPPISQDEEVGTKESDREDGETPDRAFYGEDEGSSRESQTEIGNASDQFSAPSTKDEFDPALNDEGESVKQRVASLLQGRITELEKEVSAIRIELLEERLQRENLANVIPELMKNQDEVLKLLQSLNSAHQ